ncbi:MAG: cytoplasmic iron level regulating protein YaaA (DUF328/UPF0246 family) [Arenicella sp.]|jgi:cytoplasmic iron level regulating protein YaaA (DUF328/UPF0246 family)
MLFVISPAKTLDFDSKPQTETYSNSVFLAESETLIKKLRTVSESKLQDLMKISDNLASLNKERYANWKKEMSLPEAKQALLAFRGDVYQGMEAENFSETDFEFSQSHLRILSGLYGMLKPLDLMLPYRLEMGTKLEVGKSKNLYAFWDGKVTEKLNEDLKNHHSKTLINLASNEYFKVVQSKNLEAEIITPVFKDFKNGKYKVISFFAKKARGMMASFAIKNQLSNPEKLKNFDLGGYAYNEDASKENEWVFLRG